MAAIFQRMPEAGGDLDAQTRTHKWCLTGITGVDTWILDEATALNYALTYIPSYLTTEALFRQNVTPSTPGGLLWYFDVVYGPVPKGIGEWKCSFDTTGGTIARTHSLECMNAYVPTGSTNPATKSCAIGLQVDGDIKGTDVVVPVAKRTYTYRHPKGVVTEAYMDYIEVLAGITNLTPWHGRPRGEVLFLGCKGETSSTGVAECSLAYDFAFMKNKTGMTIGENGWDQVTGITKNGQHVLDVVFEDQPRGTPAVSNKKILVVRIHRIYEELNFYSYLGF